MAATTQSKTTVPTPALLKISNARTHNLKNLSLEIPLDQIAVVTGRSGSGKSSLAIDTIFAEGQRQYIESLSLYSRQFFKQLPVADADSITGIPPTVCIDQKHGTINRRSTVGTLTEIYDYLRVLMARVGVLHCPSCDAAIEQQTPSQIVQAVFEMPERTKLMVLSPMVVRQSGNHQATLQAVRRERLVRVRINNEIYDIEQVPMLDESKQHSIEAVADRIIVRDGIEERLLEAIALAQRISGGRVIVACLEPDKSGKPSAWTDRNFSTRLECAYCNTQFENLQPRNFSFNSPYGACETCHGLGVIEQDDDLHNETTCHVCNGNRLNALARSVRFNHRHLGQIIDLPVDQAIPFFEEAKANSDVSEIAKPLLAPILHRLRYLEKVGVPYLTLGRSANSLSGGEHQRVRLATSIGSGLSNVIYILDEPSIGLHPRDNERLIESIQQLCETGNSVLLVEHDEAIIRIADHVIDVGPSAGEHGGRIVAQGTVEQIIAEPNSLTGDYLAGRRCVDAPHRPRKFEPHQQIRIAGASGRNLKSIDVEFPRGVLVGVSGVSGSGKSTLVNETLVPAVRQHLKIATSPPQPLKSIEGIEPIQHLVVVDQSRIGRSARGCPATVVGIFDDLRRIFAATRRAKQLGFGTGRFSFNAKSGWCPECRGHGTKRIELNFMPDFETTCDVCQGRRFNLQTLSVKFNDRSIADVLDMSIEQARSFFDGFEKIARPLQSLIDIGLGYVKLGQSTTTLSGGETQRLKLGTELAKSSLEHTLYVLDEPTTGLHFEDVRVLLKTLNQLVDAGNSMIVVEHNLDVLRSCDWLIDLGPEGGEGGGQVVAIGTPDEVAQAPASYTGRFLRQSGF